MADKKMKKGLWRCAACGYIYEGEAPPATCPKCGAGAEEFARIKKAPASKDADRFDQIMQDFDSYTEGTTPLKIGDLGE